MSFSAYKLPYTVMEMCSSDKDCFYFRQFTHYHDLKIRFLMPMDVIRMSLNVIDCTKGQSIVNVTS